MIIQTDADAFLADLMDEFPHGSGINGDWDLFGKSGRIASFSNVYTRMNGETGFEEGDIPFRAVFSYDSKKRIAKLLGVKSSEKSFMMSAICGECDGDHLKDCDMCNSIGEFGDGSNCPFCAGKGYTVCPECNEEGVVMIDDLPDTLSHLEETIGWEYKL